MAEVKVSIDVAGLEPSDYTYNDNAAVSQKSIIKSISQWQSEIHDLAKEKGWWSSERSTEGIYMLIASEAFEAFEDYRKNKPEKYYEEDKPCGESIEMADIVLRVMDYCEYRGWDLEALMKEKHEFNKSRDFRHGGKKL